MWHCRFDPESVQYVNIGDKPIWFWISTKANIFLHWNVFFAEVRGAVWGHQPGWPDYIKALEFCSSQTTLWLVAIFTLEASVSWLFPALSSADSNPSLLILTPQESEKSLFLSLHFPFGKWCLGDKNLYISRHVSNWCLLTFASAGLSSS